MDGIGRNARHKPQLDGFVRQQPHRPVVMPIGHGATRHGDQMGRLQARQRAAPTLLHLIVQDGFQPAYGVARADIGHRGLADIKGRYEVLIGPSLVHFE